MFNILPGPPKKVYFFLALTLTGKICVCMSVLYFSKPKCNFGQARHVFFFN